MPLSRLWMRGSVASEGFSACVGTGACGDCGHFQLRGMGFLSTGDCHWDSDAGWFD